MLHGAEIFVSPWVPYNAYLAVDFFFLLSGYVLARGFDDRLRAGWAAPFMVRRLIRLYPFVVAGSLIGGLMLLLRSILAHALPLSLVGLHTACSLLLAPTPPILSQNWSIYPNDPPLWSLFYELLANLAYALLAPWLSNRVLAVILAASAGAFAGAILIFHSADFSLDHFEFGGVRVTFSFFLGVAFFRLEGHLPAWLGCDQRPATRNLVTALSFLVLAAVLFSPAKLSAAYALVSIFLVFPALLLLALRFETAALRRTFVFLGAVSYPVYALHHPFFRLMSGVFVHNAALPLRMIGLSFSVVGAVALAWLADRFYDAPIRRWLIAHLLIRSQRRTGGVRDLAAASPSAPISLHKPGA